MGSMGTQEEYQTKTTGQQGSGTSAAQEEYTGGVLVPALLGGLIAAVIGGAIWGGIGIWTGAEIGYVAWGVGLLCGFGVVMMSKGQRGMPLQIVAIISGLIGILIGKYIIVHNIVTTVVGEDQGAAAAEAISLFSMDMVSFFAANIGSVASGFDLLWIALAVFTAWSIPKASGLKI